MAKREDVEREARRIADSLARADASGRSGSVTLYASEELDLGRQGSGEVEFYVTASYKFDFEFKSLKGVYGDWFDNDEKPTKAVPRAAIEAALRKIVERNPKRFVDALTEKL